MLFFVSIGMLVNPSYLLANTVSVILLTMLVVLGKPVLTMLLGLVFPWPARTTLVVSAGLSQIGEFSFILGQAGVSLGMLAQDQYSLILAAAMLSMIANPFMFRLVSPVERRLHSWPALWERLNRHGPSPALPEEGLANHVVIVGYGRVGRHIVSVLDGLGLQYLVVDEDAERIQELNQRNISTLFGNAANSEVLVHAGLARAQAIVVTSPDEATGALIVTAARDLAPDLPIIARGATTEGVKQLARLGAQTVIHPEMEGGLEIVRHLLLLLGYSHRQVYEYTEAVRQDHYDLVVNTEEEHRLLSRLVEAAGSMEITWLRVYEDSPIAGQTLAKADVRARTGASVVAILRDRELMANPNSMTVLQPGDRIGLIGDKEQIARAETVLALPPPARSNGKENPGVATL